jgi:putative hydrolase of HD superfamily
VNTDFDGLLRTLEACSAVKEVDRKGWSRRAGISSPESVADHIFATAFAAMMVGDILRLDAEKMMRMAILHDLCEAVTGDIQPGEMEPSRKLELEASALADLLRSLPAPLRESYLKCFDDFNHGTSRESLLVMDLDKLEMVVQASVYEKKGIRRELLEEFWRSADRLVKTDEGREMLSSAASLRPRRSTP